MAAPSACGVRAASAWDRMTAAGSPAAARMRRRLAARSLRKSMDVSRIARAARVALASGLMPAASSRSSRAARLRASTRCHGRSRPSVNRPRSSCSRTCIAGHLPSTAVGGWRSQTTAHPCPGSLQSCAAGAHDDKEAPTENSDRAARQVPAISPARAAGLGGGPDEPVPLGPMAKVSDPGLIQFVVHDRVMHYRPLGYLLLMKSYFTRSGHRLSTDYS